MKDFLFKIPIGWKILFILLSFFIVPGINSEIVNIQYLRILDYLSDISLVILWLGLLFYAFEVRFFSLKFWQIMFWVNLIIYVYNVITLFVPQNVLRIPEALLSYNYNSLANSPNWTYLIYFSILTVPLLYINFKLANETKKNLKGSSKKHSFIVGIILAGIILYSGWSFYSNHIDSVFKKFLPEKILSFQLNSISKRPNTDNRAVVTDKGEEPVFLNSGYRAFYVTPGKLPFLRIHPERSPIQSFESDKKVIEREYQFMALQEKAYIFNKETYHNHDYYLVGDPTKDLSGVREIATIFFPEDSMLITIYFFNQGPDSNKWDYRNSNEYKELRSKFITNYIDSALQYHSN